MIKKLILPIAISLALVAQVSCNDDGSDDEYVYESSASVMVSAFYLQNDANVLDSLKNVYFSIDLEAYQIFNADSLPYGTDVSRLIPVITTPSTASVVELTFKTTAETDTVVNYLTNSTDSIDFSNGIVKLRVVSEAAIVEKTYDIHVNVHQVKPDTLAWNQLQSAQLPTTITKLEAQRTACCNDKYYCLTSGDGIYVLGTVDDPGAPTWEMKEVDFPFVPDVESLASAGNLLYMLDADGNLYSSADCADWSPTGLIWKNIYGQYEGQILGCANFGDAWTIESYPSLATWPMPDGFPVKNASAPCTYTLPMAYAPQLVMAGGCDADGNATNGVWGFDGEMWGKISNKGLPVELSGPAVVSYDLFDVQCTNWTPVKYPALVLIGGLLSDQATVNRTVYMSSDWGLTWKEAPDLMQLPDEVPALASSSAFVYSTTMYVSRAADGWLPIGVKSLPPHCSFIYPGERASRVVSVPTEWECPAIYLFGGRDAAGDAVNALWRGVILRYTFEPTY